MKRFLPVFVVVFLLVGGLPGVAVAQGDPALDELFTWGLHGLSMPYPAGWITQVVSDEMAVLLADPADIAVISEEVPPQAPLLAVLITTNKDFFGPDSVTGDLTTTVEYWLPNSDIEDPLPVVAGQIAGVEALRVRGLNTVNTGYVDGYFAYLPDGRLLVLLGLVPEAQYEAFQPTLAAMFAGVSLQAPTPVEDAPLEDSTLPEAAPQDALASQEASPVWSDAGLSLQLPDGWVSRNISGEYDVVAVAFASTEADLDAVASAVAPETAGVLLVATSSPEKFFGDNITGNTIQERAENWSTHFFERSTSLQAMTLFGQPAVLVEGYRSNGNTRFIMILAQDAGGRVVIVMGLTPEGQQEAFYDEFLAILNSLSAIPLTETLYCWPFNIAIDYLPAWRRSVEQDGVCAVLANPEDDPGSTPTAPAIMMVVLDAVSSASLDVPLDALLRSLIEGQMEGTGLDIHATTIAGYEAVRTPYRQSNGNLQGEGALIRTGKHTVMILAVAPQDQFAGFVPVIEATLASFAEDVLAPEHLLSETFRWPEKGFAIRHPGGWQIHQLDAVAYRLFPDPGSEPVTPSTVPVVDLIAGREAGLASAEATPEDVISAFAISQFGMEPGSRPINSITVDGHPAAWLTMSHPQYDAYVTVLAVAAPQETFLLLFATPSSQIEDFSWTQEFMTRSIVIE